jgi:GntR family transcriptional regulator
MSRARQDDSQTHPRSTVGSMSSKGPTPHLRGVSRDTLVAKAHAELLEAIEARAFVVGQRLPAEHELARSLGVSRATVREALGQLQLQGHITRRPGDGTYVTDRGERFVDELDRFDGVDRLATEQGLELLSGETQFETIEADVSIAEALEIPRGCKIHTVTRTIGTDAGPAIHMVDYIPIDLISAQELRDGFRGVVRGLLVEAVPDASYSQIEITARLADAELANRLHLAGGALVLVVEETVFTETGSPVEFSRNYYNPTRVTLRTVQKRHR